MLLLVLDSQLQNNTGPNPELTCKNMTLCDGTCSMLHGQWPLPSPVWPTDGGVIDQRRRLSDGGAGTAGLPHSFTDIQSILTFTAALQAHEAMTGRSMTLTELITFGARFIASSFLAKVAPAVVQPLRAPPCDGGLNLSCDITRVFDLHLPLADNDGDNFAPLDVNDTLLTNHLRGADWRGRDCNDNDATIYPGRRASTHGAGVDHNCNGIVGSNPSGAAYEDAFCSGPNAPMGVAVLGDSAGAHFHLPQQYLNAKSLSLDGIIEMALNEADWPQCSWGTGFRERSQCPTMTNVTGVNVTMASIYQRFRQRNLCMHRDYQNLGVRGLPRFCAAQ